MPLFVSDAELEALGGDVEAIVGLADQKIRALQEQCEAEKAASRAAAVNAEQTCAAVESKFVAVSAENAALEQEKTALQAQMDVLARDLAQAKADAHQRQLASVKAEHDVERQAVEIQELGRARRQLLTLVEQKDTELTEKGTAIKQYLERIVELTDAKAEAEARARSADGEALRCRNAQTLQAQEKAVLEQHLAWLREDVAAKSSALLEERRSNEVACADLTSKLAQTERELEAAQGTASLSRERVSALEALVHQLQQDVKAGVEEAVLQESQLMAQLQTAKRMAELYKEGAEEAGKRASSLQGAMTALEEKVKQLEQEHSQEIGVLHAQKEQELKELQSRMEGLQAALDAARAAAAAAQRQGTDGAPIEFAAAEQGGRGSLDLAQLLPAQRRAGASGDGAEDAVLPSEGRVPPALPPHVTGAAVAAHLIREGWTLSTMYEKYEEAADAWRHERQQRRHGEALLHKILREVEAKASVVMEERAEHGHLVAAYSALEQKLRDTGVESARLEASLLDALATAEQKQRHVRVLEGDIKDLQHQVAVLLRNLRDTAGARGAIAAFVPGENAPVTIESLSVVDIRTLVENNTALRHDVRVLQEELETLEATLKEKYEKELAQRGEEVSRAVERMVEELKAREEAASHLKSAHDMYKMMYEEQQRRQNRPLSPGPQAAAAAEEGGPTAGAVHVPPALPGSGPDYAKLYSDTEKELQKLRADVAEHNAELQQNLASLREEVGQARVARAVAESELKFVKEQRDAAERVVEAERAERMLALQRNSEFGALITEHQKRLREGQQRIAEAEDKARALAVEVSVLEREKAVLASAEERSSREAGEALARCNKLQAMLDTIQGTDSARQALLTDERKRLEQEVNRLQREWQELQQSMEAERRHSRELVLERDRSKQDADRLLQEASKRAEDARADAAAATVQAKLLEEKCQELQARVNSAEDQLRSPEHRTLPRTDSARRGTAVVEARDGAGPGAAAPESSTEELQEALAQAHDELSAARASAEQYKSIALANEEAMKAMTDAHNEYCATSEAEQAALRIEKAALQHELAELKADVDSRSAAAADAAADAEKAIAALIQQKSQLETTVAQLQAEAKELRETAVKAVSEAEASRAKCREAQQKYEEQVLQQADTIRDREATAKCLAKMEEEARAWKDRAEAAEMQLQSTRVQWDLERQGLEAAKAAAETKATETEAQNRVLLDRFEALPPVFAGAGALGLTQALQAPGAVEPSGDGAGSAEPGSGADAWGEVQEVVRFLRRSKEASDLEVSLMRQERLRLQKQLESAEGQLDDARRRMREEQERAGKLLQTDQEFRHLKDQVLELSLLRESNALLREENQRNLAKAAEWQARAQKLEEAAAPLQEQLREKVAELEAKSREVAQMQAEAARWQQRANQLVEKYKAVDLDEYRRVQAELQQTQAKLKGLEEQAKSYGASLDAKQQQMEAAERTRDEAVRAREQALKEKVQAETARTQAEAARTEAEANKQSAEEQLKKAQEEEVKQKERYDTLRRKAQNMRDNWSKKLQEQQEKVQKAEAELQALRDSGNAAAAAQRQEKDKAVAKAAEAHGKELEKREAALKAKIQELTKQLSEERGRRQKFVGAAQRSNEKLKEVTAKVQEMEKWKDEHAATLRELQGTLQAASTLTPAAVAPVEAQLEALVVPGHVGQGIGAAMDTYQKAHQDFAASLAALEGVAPAAVPVPEAPSSAAAPMETSTEPAAAAAAPRGAPAVPVAATPVGTAPADSGLAAAEGLKRKRVLRDAGLAAGATAGSAQDAVADRNAQAVSGQEELDADKEKGSKVPRLGTPAEQAAKPAVVQAAAGRGTGVPDQAALLRQRLLQQRAKAGTGVPGTPPRKSPPPPTATVPPAAPAAASLGPAAAASAGAGSTRLAVQRQRRFVRPSLGGTGTALAEPVAQAPALAAPEAPITSAAVSTVTVQPVSATAVTPPAPVAPPAAALAPAPTAPAQAVAPAVLAPSSAQAEMSGVTDDMQGVEGGDAVADAAEELPAETAIDEHMEAEAPAPAEAAAGEEGAEGAEPGLVLSPEPVADDETGKALPEEEGAEEDGAEAEGALGEESQQLEGGEEVGEAEMPEDNVMTEEGGSAEAAAPENGAGADAGPPLAALLPEAAHAEDTAAAKDEAPVWPSAEEAAGAEDQLAEEVPGNAADGMRELVQDEPVVAEAGAEEPGTEGQMPMDAGTGSELPQPATEVTETPVQSSGAKETQPAADFTEEKAADAEDLDLGDADAAVPQNEGLGDAPLDLEETLEVSPLAPAPPAGLPPMDPGPQMDPPAPASVAGPEAGTVAAQGTQTQPSASTAEPQGAAPSLAPPASTSPKRRGAMARGAGSVGRGRGRKASASPATRAMAAAAVALEGLPPVGAGGSEGGDAGAEGGEVPGDASEEVLANRRLMKFAPLPQPLPAGRARGRAPGRRGAAGAAAGRGRARGRARGVGRARGDGASTVPGEGSATAPVTATPNPFSALPEGDQA